jgi:hypothetical protein
MKCRLCDDVGLAIRLADGSVIYECIDDTEQVAGLAWLIADRSLTGFANADPDLREKIYRVALDAIRKANR